MNFLISIALWTLYALPHLALRLVMILWPMACLMSANFLFARILRLDPGIDLLAVFALLAVQAKIILQHWSDPVAINFHNRLTAWLVATMLYGACLSTSLFFALGSGLLIVCVLPHHAMSPALAASVATAHFFYFARRLCGHILITSSSTLSRDRMQSL